jgi:peptidoglycan/xylan/chitin deacetylase (PgdA/CDA1 family)
VILAYHNVVPDTAASAGDRSLHLPRSQFARQLDRLAETHAIVALQEVLRTGPGTGRPRAVLTFDDAYRGTLEHALPELTRRGMAATLFVAPGLLGDRAFWWDLLASPTEGEVPARLRNRALQELAGRHHEILEECASDDRGDSNVPDHFRSATEEELRAAVDEHRITLGSHTWSHPNLTELDDSAVLLELQQSWQWLTDRFSSVVPWLAYPYGLMNERVASLAGSVFQGALSLTGRLVPTSLDALARYEVPRVNIPASLSQKRFELRVAGVPRA